MGSEAFGGVGVLQVEGVSKRFGPVQALDGVGLEVRAGTVHGVLGENGAGKSTLMNVVYGLIRADAGQVSVDGQPLHAGSPRQAQRAGIGMVHQHFKLVPTLSVAENVALTVGRGIGWINRRAVRTRVQEIAAGLKWKMDPRRIVGDLSVGEQQRVEIIRALAAGGTRGGKVLILDEPTAVLAPEETRELIAAMRALAARGAAVVFISHKLAEVEAACDEVTVLRRGKIVWHGAMHGVSKEALAERMVGGPVELPAKPGARRQQPEGVPAFELRDVWAGMLKDASLCVRAGQIVGVAGVEGNGQADLVGVITGTRPAARGEVRMGGVRANDWPIRQRMDRMGFVAEDRQREALVLPLNLTQNLMLKAYRRRPFSVMGWIRAGAWRQHAEELVHRFDVRGQATDPVGSLSGGNQQRLVLARELSNDKPLVVAVNPTRGLDVGATAFVMRQLLAARGRGAGVLLIHSDLDELLAISDRVLVLYNGTLRESNGDRECVGRMMMGLDGETT